MKSVSPTLPRYNATNAKPRGGGHHASNAISPSSRMETGYVSARFLSPAMGFPTTGNVGSFGHHSPMGSPVFKSNSDPCTGHATPPRSVRSPIKGEFYPPRANPCGDTRCLSRKPPRQTLESICGLSRRRRTRIFLPFFLIRIGLCRCARCARTGAKTTTESKSSRKEKKTSSRGEEG